MGTLHFFQKKCNVPICVKCSIYAGATKWGALFERKCLQCFEVYMILKMTSARMQKNTKRSVLMIEFGEQLRMAREAKGLTQKALGDKLYVSRQSVSHWECGDRYPDLVTLKKISQILEVSLDNLLSGKEMVKVVEKKPVIENKIINSMIAALYAFIVLMLFLKVTEDLAMHYVHAYARFVTQETSGVYYTDTNMAVEQIVLMIVFVYGLINTIRDTLTPKKIGVVLIVFS